MKMYNHALGREVEVHTRAEVAYNTRTKYICDASGNWIPYETVVFARPAMMAPGWESPEEHLADDVIADDVSDAKRRKASEDDPNYRYFSFRRAVRNIFDHAISDPRFDSFVTLTLNRERVDRTNYDEIVKKLNPWLSNRVQRRDLIYVLVPELHADRKGIHFHGLCNSSAMKLIDSGHTNNAQPVYNVVDFELGFSTLMMFGRTGLDRLRVAKYMVKYMIKANGDMIGGRFYLHGGKIRGCRYEYSDSDYFAAAGDVRQLPWNGEEYKVIKHDVVSESASLQF